MYFYYRKMVTNTILKYADSSSNYYVIIMVQNLKKLKTRKFPKKSHSRGMKCQPKATNNCFAVFVCARDVVKRPIKHMRATKYIDYTRILYVDLCCLHCRKK